MNYEDVQKQLTGKLDTLQRKLVDPDLTSEDSDMLTHMIDNYQYILEMAEMNNFHRGIKH